MLLVGLSLPGWSETIIDGPTWVGGLAISYQQSVAVSWAVSSGFTNVSIAVPLWTDGWGLSETGTAYLVSSVRDSPMLSAQFAFPVIPLGGKLGVHFVGLFDNLTLSPGTYYLTLMSAAPGMSEGWIDFDPLAATQIAPGVTLGATYAGFPADGPYLGQQPSPSGFRSSPLFDRAGLRISGDAADDFTGDPIITAAPEPPTYALIFGMALIGVAALQWKKPFAQPAAQTRRNQRFL